MNKNCVVLYKNQCAVVQGQEGEKFLVRYCAVPATTTGKKAVYVEQKVREKDFVVLCEQSCSSLENALAFNDENISRQIAEVHELLLSDEATASEKIDFISLCELLRNEIKPDEVFFVYKNLCESFEFSLCQEDLKNSKIAFLPCSPQEIEEAKQKKYEKEHEEEIRLAFIERLKNRKLELPGDARFMGEVEAFALCKTDKCKTLKEACIAQSIEKAHSLLIETGIWDYTKNPYPTRFGFSFDSAKEQLGAMPDEERIKVPGTAYAIDSEHSTDPDDAVAFDGEYLWVHIADPASSVLPDSSIDIAARNRGTTLYIPEGASRMLCESSLEDYALGLKNPSRALSFKLKLDENAGVESCEVLKTEIYVERLSYKVAEEKKESPELKPLFEIARKNILKRKANGSVDIDMPEVHISVDKETKKVSLENEIRYESNDMIREMMLLAGEGAAKFAFKNQIPFPYVSQEEPQIPENLPEGLAGEFAKIKCMRKRSVGITPSPHASLGLSFYSQVTSPLRRYGDLIAHEQLRAFLNGQKLIGKDEMLEKISAGDAASIAARKASRMSEMHWKLVYLLQDPELSFEGVCIDKKGADAQILIPALDMQTTLAGYAKNMELNDKVVLKMKTVDIPNQGVLFTVEA